MTDPPSLRIRKAALALRELLNEIPPGQWSMRDGWGGSSMPDGLTRVARIADPRHDTVLNACNGPGAELCGDANVFNYIATMGPTVGRPLMAWLEVVGDQQRVRELEQRAPLPNIGWILGIADGILGSVVPDGVVTS